MYPILWVEARVDYAVHVLQQHESCLDAVSCSSQSQSSTALGTCPLLPGINAYRAYFTSVSTGRFNPQAIFTCQVEIVELDAVWVRFCGIHRNFHSADNLRYVLYAVLHNLGISVHSHNHSSRVQERWERDGERASAMQIRGATHLKSTGQSARQSKSHRSAWVNCTRAHCERDLSDDTKTKFADTAGHLLLTQPSVEGWHSHREVFPDSLLQLQVPQCIAILVESMESFFTVLSSAAICAPLGAAAEASFARMDSTNSATSFLHRLPHLHRAEKPDQTAPLPQSPALLAYPRQQDGAKGQPPCGSTPEPSSIVAQDSRIAFSNTIITIITRFVLHLLIDDIIAADAMFSAGRYSFCRPVALRWPVVETSPRLLPPRLSKYYGSGGPVRNNNGKCLMAVSGTRGVSGPSFDSTEPATLY